MLACAACRFDRAPELLEVFRRLERRGKIETAHRTKQRVGQVIRYAIATRRAERDPTADLRGAFGARKVQNRAALPIPETSHSSCGQSTVSRALSVEAAFGSPLGIRSVPGSCAAEWTEVDLDAAEWRIAAHRTKMRRQHIVPLANQAVTMLRDLHPLSGADGTSFLPRVPSPDLSATTPLPQL